MDLELSLVSLKPWMDVTTDCMNYFTDFIEIWHEKLMQIAIKLWFLAILVSAVCKIINGLPPYHISLHTSSWNLTRAPILKYIVDSSFWNWALMQSHKKIDGSGVKFKLWLTLYTTVIDPVRSCDWPCTQHQNLSCLLYLQHQLPGECSSLWGMTTACTYIAEEMYHL